MDRWRADDVLPGRAPSADSSVRRRINGLELHPGDVIRIEGVPDQQDRAPLDYIEVIPAVQLGDMPLRPWISP